MIKYKRTLVANRGEIAVRIIRALRELGIETIAIYSKADAGAIHTKLADNKICIGEADSLDSYLNSYKIISAATLLGADSIHPGIGFFAESEDFAKLCEEYNIDFIGPNSDLMKLMANKESSKILAAKVNVPVIDGSKTTIKDFNECETVVRKLGLPVIIKATHGGGGKGIRAIHNIKDVLPSYNMVINEAKAAFDNSDILVEKFLDHTRHVEVQILADKYGNVIHLGDRECTIQNHNQKLIEETRCVNITDDLREKLYKDAVNIAKEIKYIGPGTVEFLVLPDNTYFFLEMNTRLQVEHTITELITNIDIVKEQIKLFSGEQLSLNQQDVKFNGYAVQCRILAEYLKDTFIPSFGEITKMHLPGGFGIRVDTGYSSGDIITPFYDPLLVKISCVAKTKYEAIKKMKVALDEVVIEGIKTNVNFLKNTISSLDFVNGNYDNRYIDKFIINKNNVI
ncbi:acetyl-CoA carboxylase biotin carboxylase subunit [Clostridium felsineum]|uniref:biotin carboxylase n=1 Tax=Clostridium felsineum TaxID=36839 RepID=A0A1S8MHW0_9CLOT|nr:biotin carboxylase N-terminal domain-containing protein [Clostridium felsineum]MCR3759109.1 ATP-grasp domain-containing protein [Clostridium felsineum]URZ07171.1 2-oxoglutarate carboxylase small subunit [Clostridium felsineum]URZ12200.1 2-oxoglutarate carboxylase small subunit [Clostridium felsineum]